MIALKNEAHAVKQLYANLLANLLICTLITVVILLITQWTINDFEARSRSQQAEIHSLRGILPICSLCKKIRDDQGYWSQIETYIKQHSDAHFTHGMCPDCMRQTYPDLYSNIDRISKLLAGGRRTTIEELARATNQDESSLQRILNLMLDDKTLSLVEAGGVQYYRLSDKHLHDA